MKKQLILLLAAASLSAGQMQAQHVWNSVATGDATTYAIRDDGSLWACGWNEAGQLGVPEVTERTAIFSLVGTDKNWKYAAGGKSYAFFLKQDGTMWAVGTREGGVQGTGDGMDHKTPVQIGTDNDWAYVTACRFWGYSGFAIKADGTLWGWGDNSNYQLGTGTNERSSTPIQIGTDNDWATVTAGASHVVALKTDGSMWGWGNNLTGGLGMANEENYFYSTPIKINEETDWAYIQAIGNRTYAVKKDGSLWGTGDNDRNILGLNQPEETVEQNIYAFTRITAIQEKVISVSGCEVTTSVATGENGVISKIYIWGSNADGALGDGKGKIITAAEVPFSTTPVTPLLEEGLTFKQLSSGQGYSMTITADGQMYGWGRNKGGQLGDGTDYDLLQTSFYKKPIAIDCPQEEVEASAEKMAMPVSVQFNGTEITASETIEDANLYAASGALVKSQAALTGSWDVADLASGVYILSYRQNGKHATLKIMKR